MRRQISMTYLEAVAYLLSTGWTQTQNATRFCWRDPQNPKNLCDFTTALKRQKERDE